MNSQKTLANIESFSFGPFRLDQRGLWKGQEYIRLTRTPLAVLRLLVRHTGKTVSYKQLREETRGVEVEDGSIHSDVNKIRSTLKKHSSQPFIETNSREGYRFVVTPHPATTSSFVGRTEELKRLHDSFEQALAGARQTVLITGEPGVGKSTLVNEFIEQVKQGRDLWVAKTPRWSKTDSPIEFGLLIEALTQLIINEEETNQQVRKILNDKAPTWLTYLTNANEELRLRTLGSNPLHLRYGLEAAIQAFSDERPFVLVLEDLHHSDDSTLAVLHYLAEQQKNLRLLIIGTYRSQEALSDQLHQLVGEVRRHGKGQEIHLPLLSLQAVQSHLATLWENAGFVPSFAREIHSKTKGNALFMTDMVKKILRDEIVVEKDGGWEQRESLATMSIPDDTQKFIEQLIRELPKGDRRILEVASVVGERFSASLVAAALGREDQAVQSRCSDLAKQERFIKSIDVVSWPDDTPSSEYGFQHKLHREALNARLDKIECTNWHRLIAERLERGYGSQAPEVATELAVHFEKGARFRKAVHYWEMAAQQELSRNNYLAARNFAQNGLACLSRLRNVREHNTGEELSLQSILGTSTIPVEGPGHGDVKHAYTRAHELCKQLQDTSQLVHILFGLHRYHNFRGDHDEARRFADQMRTLTNDSAAYAYIPLACIAQGETSWYLGQLQLGCEQIKDGIVAYQSHLQDALTLRYGIGNFPVNARAYLSVASLYLGNPTKAIQALYEARELSQQQEMPFSQVFFHLFETIFYQLLDEPNKVRESAKFGMDVADKYGFKFQHHLCEALEGWALVMQGQGEGVGQIKEAFHAYERMSGWVGQPYFLGMWGESLGQVREFPEAQKKLTQAFEVMKKTNERFYEAELYRIKGDLILLEQEHSRRTTASTNTTTNATRKSKLTRTFLDPGGEAEASFFEAIAIAQNQQAKFLELRAVLKLSRLWKEKGKKAQALKLLSKVYNRFTEGFDTKDLQAAAVLITELSY